MASGDLIEFFRPTDLIPETGPVGALPVGAGSYEARPLGKASSYLTTFQVPQNGTPLSTGLTVKVAVTDDPLNPNLSGVIVVGVTIVPLLTAAGTLADPVATNEVTGTITINAVEGVETQATIALPNAKLSSLAAGNFALMRIRRVGSNASDTDTGRALLFGVGLQDT